MDKNGRKFIRVKSVRWFTNLDHGRRHQPLPLMSMSDNIKFSKHKQIKNNHYENMIIMMLLKYPIRILFPVIMTE